MSTAPRIHAALSLDGLGTDARAAFDLAADAGYGGIALPTKHPQVLSPGDFGDSARRHFLNTLHHRHLTLDAIRIAAPRNGLTDPASIDRTLENARKAFTLAHALGVKTVSLYAGPLANAKLSAETMAGAARVLASEADRAGVTLALSSESGKELQTLLAAVAAEHFRANLDPAGLVAAGADALAVAAELGERIGQFTAADAIRAGRQCRAVELDEGQVPLRELVEQLREQGFTGPTVVDVRDLGNAAVGARRAAEVLRGLGV